MKLPIKTLKRIKKEYSPLSILLSGVQMNLKKASSFLASEMQQRCNKLSLKTKWLYLFLFCFITVALYSYVSIIKFYSTDKVLVQKPDRIKIGVKLERSLPLRNVLSKKVYEKGSNLRVYADSLEKSAAGKTRLEQINRHYPGLLDSIRTVERIYQLQ